MKDKPSICFVSTVPLTLKMFCIDLIRDLSRQYYVRVVSSPEKELDEIASDGVDTFAVPLQRRISPVSDVIAVWRLSVLFRRHKPSIVHSLTPKAGLIAMIAACMARVPVRVHSFTGLLFPTAPLLKRCLFKLTDYITCTCATQTIAEGKGVCDNLVSAGVARRQPYVLGHGSLRGIDLGFYDRHDTAIAESDRIASSYGISTFSFTFLFVGRLVPDKGIEELIQGFSEVSKRHKDIHLVLVGHEEPDLSPLPKETLTAIEQHPHIHYTNQWIKDVRPYYIMADAMVLPSHREGLPNVVIEAGAMSLPSIVSDIPGAQEIIIPGYNGDRFQVKDVNALASLMERYVTDRKYVKRLSANCREHIASRYDCHNVHDNMKKFYATQLSALTSK